MKNAKKAADESGIEKLEYTGRAAVMDAEAMKARLANDATRYAEFRREIKSVEKFSVQAANIGRELGVSFAEYWLPPNGPAAEAYFKAHYATALGMSFAVFGQLRIIARKLREPVKKMEELFPALQLTLFAGELLQEPERREPQTAHDGTPVQFFFEKLGKTRVEIEKAMGKVSEWDEETRTAIREQVEKFAAWLQSIKERME